MKNVQIQIQDEKCSDPDPGWKNVQIGDIKSPLFTVPVAEIGTYIDIYEWYTIP
jgi:hypothetical protein